MKKLFCIFTLIAILALSAATTMGCASMRYASAKDSYITKQVQSYTFSSDINNVMAQAKALLYSSGYAVRPSMNPYSIETEWGIVEEHTMRQYLVTATAVGNGTTIRFDYVENTHNPGYKPATQRGRDYVMEYELIKRLEPDKWSAIEQAAVAYANKKK